MAEILARRVGRHVARLRNARDIRQADLARMAGVDRSGLSQIENGRYAGLALDTLEKICTALHVSVKEFFDSMPGG